LQQEFARVSLTRYGSKADPRALELQLSLLPILKTKTASSLKTKTASSEK
jgi:hypothetical protein